MGCNSKCLTECSHMDDYLHSIVFFFFSNKCFRIVQRFHMHAAFNSISSFFYVAHVHC